MYSFFFLGTNKLILIGGSRSEIDLVRSVIKSRWPYPISRDEELFLDDKNKAWLFKLKRQPWAVSYGNKSFDRAVEIAQTLLHKSLPPPKNTDTSRRLCQDLFLHSRQDDLKLNHP